MINRNLTVFFATLLCMLSMHACTNSSEQAYKRGVEALSNNKPLQAKNYLKQPAENEFKDAADLYRQLQIYLNEDSLTQIILNLSLRESYMLQRDGVHVKQYSQNQDLNQLFQHKIDSLFSIRSDIYTQIREKISSQKQQLVSQLQQREIALRKEYQQLLSIQFSAQGTPVSIEVTGSQSDTLSITGKPVSEKFIAQLKSQGKIQAWYKAGFCTIFLIGIDGTIEQFVNPECAQ